MSYCVKSKCVLKNIVLTIFIFLLVYFFCTPIGALRLAIFPWAPETAVSTHIHTMFNRERQQQLQKEEIPFFVTVYVFQFENAPIDKQTKGPMITWKVYRFGPLCLATYFGEG